MIRDFLNRKLRMIISDQEDDLLTLIENRVNFFFRGMVLILITLASLFVIFNIMTGLLTAAAFDFAIASIMIVIYVLYRYKKYLLSKIIFLCTLNIVIYVFALFYEREVGLYLFFMPLISLALAIFQSAHRKFSYIFTALSVVLMLSLLFFTPHWFQPVVLNGTMTYSTFLVNLFCSVFILVVTLYYFLYVINTTDARIIKINLALQQKNAELNEANNMLDKFAYSVSHDLRAPLSSIKGLSSLGRMESANTEMRDYFNKISDCANDLDNFIKNTLDYYKDQKEKKSEEVDIYELTQSIIQHFKHMENASRMDFKVNFKMSNTFFMLDSLLFRTILGNLLSNAIKYQDTSKNNPFVTIDADYKQGMLHLKISDNGNGISDQHLTKIFNLFYMSDTSSDKSSGVGLHLVQEAVSKMNGSIKVRSEIKKGTMFSIQIPASPGKKVSNYYIGRNNVLYNIA